MLPLIVAVLWVLMGEAPAAAGEKADAMSGVVSRERAAMNWALNCQGCHRADAGGTPDGAPNMNGLVARFLSVDGGRAYLVRVPGVAFSGLADEQLAELVNWMLHAFDGQHVPADFHPYTGEEVGRLRRQPLVTEAEATRSTLLDYMERKNGDIAEK